MIYNKTVVLLGLVGAAVISLIVYFWKDAILAVFKGGASTSCEQGLARLQETDERLKERWTAVEDDSTWVHYGLGGPSSDDSVVEPNVVEPNTIRSKYATFETAFDCQ